MKPSRLIAAYQLRNSVPATTHDFFARQLSLLIPSGSELFHIIIQIVRSRDPFIHRTFHESSVTEITKQITNVFGDRRMCARGRVNVNVYGNRIVDCLSWCCCVRCEDGPVPSIFLNKNIVFGYGMKKRTAERKDFFHERSVLRYKLTLGPCHGMSGSRAATASARDSWPSSSASHDSKQSVVYWIPSSSFVGCGRCKKAGLPSRSTMRAMSCVWASIPR